MEDSRYILSTLFTVSGRTITVSREAFVRGRVLMSIAVILLLLADCASISNFSTARPVGKDHSQLTIGISKIMTESDTIPIIEKVPSFFFFEIMGTRGLTGRFDLSLKYTFPSAGFLEGKYCLVKTDSLTGFFLSPALRAGYSAFPTSGDDSTANDRMEMSLPIYLSIYPNSTFGLTVAPVLGLRFFMESESRMTQLAGAMASLSIGNKTGLIVEGDYFYNFYWQWHEIQVGAALFFPAENLFSSLHLF